MGYLAVAVDSDHSSPQNLTTLRLIYQFSNWGAQEIIAVDVEGNSEVVTSVPTTIPFSIEWQR